MNKALAVAISLYCSFVFAGSTPVKLQVSPGQQQPVTLSRLHMNRIVTPFSAPQIRTIDQADIRIEGSVIYLSSQQEEPFVVYITPHDSEAHALSGSGLNLLYRMDIDSKFNFIDQQANDNIVHSFKF